MHPNLFDAMRIYINTSTQLLADDYAGLIAAIQHVGSSRFVPEWQDVDMLVLLKDGVDVEQWQPLGKADRGYWVDCDGAEYDMESHLMTWKAMRRGRANLIITNQAGFASLFLLADEACVALNLTDKRQRIILHSVIRDGLSHSDAAARARDREARARHRVAVKKAPTGDML